MFWKENESFKASSSLFEEITKDELEERVEVEDLKNGTETAREVATRPEIHSADHKEREGCGSSITKWTNSGQKRSKKCSWIKASWPDA